METLRFKANIKCGGCVTAVTPFLNEAVGEGHWQVDMQSPQKTLTANASSGTVVKQAMEKAGYKAELIN